MLNLLLLFLLNNVSNHKIIDRQTKLVKSSNFLLMAIEPASEMVDSEEQSQKDHLTTSMVASETTRTIKRSFWLKSLSFCVLFPIYFAYFKPVRFVDRVEVCTDPKGISVTYRRIVFCFGHEPYEICSDAPQLQFSGFFTQQSYILADRENFVPYATNLECVVSEREPLDSANFFSVKFNEHFQRMAQQTYESKRQKIVAQERVKQLRRTHEIVRLLISKLQASIAQASNQILHYSQQYKKELIAFEERQKYEQLLEIIITERISQTDRQCQLRFVNKILRYMGLGFLAFDT